MLVLLIVIPAVIVAGAVVVVLDRMGVLPRLDNGYGSSGWGPGSGSGFLAGIPKAGLWIAGAVMAVWILAWIVFLVVGLSVLSG